MIKNSRIIFIPSKAFRENSKVFNPKMPGLWTKASAMPAFLAIKKSKISLPPEVSVLEEVALKKMEGWIWIRIH